MKNILFAALVLVAGCATSTAPGRRLGFAAPPLVIQDEGTSKPVRFKLNMIGSTVSCVDNTTTKATDCTISGGGATFPLLASDGSGSAPSYSFSAHPAVGCYSGGARSFICQEDTGGYGFELSLNAGGLSVTGTMTASGEVTTNDKFHSNNAGAETSTVGGVGSAAVLPAIPLGYLTIRISSGASVKMPFYNP